MKLLVHSIFHYHFAIDLKIEILVLEICFLTLLRAGLAQLKQVRQAVQQRCQTPAGSELRTCLKVLRFGVPFTCQLLLSARNLTSS